MGLVEEIKSKREFRSLPDSIVLKVIEDLDSEGKDKVKEARKVLRKYFGVFMTNKVIKPRNLEDFDSVLLSHKSSYKRDYDLLYSRLSETLKGSSFNSVIDLGCGVNGFSYPYLAKYLGDVMYLGVEALEKIVENNNDFFVKNSLDKKCSLVWGDLFDLDFIEKVLLSVKWGRVVFLFQVVDALENLEEDFSKRFLGLLQKNCEFVVLSVPVESLSGKKKFKVRRRWLLDFLKERFELLDDFVMFGERFLVLKSLSCLQHCFKST